MMRSLFAGVSGLRNHQIRMDVIGNNIANVNTVGFKASRTTFRQLFSQTLRGAARPTDDRAGTNPIQIGMGMTLGTITPVHTPGGTQVTGNATDVAISGNGFFILGQGQSRFYTRVGAFGIDAEGYLADPNTGLRVQGWMASGGKLPEPTPGNLRDIRIRIGDPIAAKATTSAKFVGNLDANAKAPDPVSGGGGDSYTMTFTVFDSLGKAHEVTLTFAKEGSNQWSWTAAVPSAVQGSVTGSGTLVFNPDGTLDTETQIDPEASTANPTLTFEDADAGTVTVKLDFSSLTQYASSTGVELLSQDGYPSGVLNSFSIDNFGVITGAYSNGVSQPIAQLALASFENPAGLIDQGGGLLIASNNSGTPDIAAAGTQGLGEIAPGSLEMSNVDLSQEFTDMIVTQRGFQANARVITASDELLRELVNLGR